MIIRSQCTREWRRCGSVSARRAWQTSRPTTMFGQSVDRCRESLRRFLTTAKQDGKRVAAYGAPAKGNTLLNYCGVGPDLVEFTVDRNPHKQGCYLPGTRIPIRHPEHLARRTSRLSAAAALEPERRDNGTGVLYPYVGREVRGADSGSVGAPVSTGPSPP